MRISKKVKMYEQIKKHGENLLRVFPAAMEKDAVALCKKLRIQENKAHRITEELCNGVSEDRQNYAECELDRIRLQVCKYLGIAADAPFMFVNRDPRGYALKLDDEWLKSQDMPLFRDWGGYGIIAPDFSEN